MSLENTILNSEKWYSESSRIRVLAIERQNIRGMTAAYGSLGCGCLEEMLMLSAGLLVSV